MELYRNGEIAVATITLEMMNNAGADESDCDDISSLPGRIGGVRCGVTIREIEDSLCKISLRTGPGLDANKICSAFDGGGHPGAAGCSIYASPEEAKGQILNEISKHMDAME
jgi:phosphoesterase RecJ-like protein